MKVIILDDSRTDSYLATQVAKNYFTEVEVCGVPGELHAALKKEPLPDLILMDVHIGDLHNGIVELDTIKANYTAASFVPVIVVTASTDAAIHQFAMNSGADGVIVKPISQDKLVPMLQVLIPEMRLKEE